MIPVFHSREAFFKSPFGAVPEGRNVRFAFCPPRDWGVTGVSLCAQFEAHHETIELPMQWSGLSGSQDVYRAVLNTKGRLGLVWYSFKLLHGTSVSYYGNTTGFGGEGGRTDNPPPAYQLTVYDNTIPVPEWYGQGMTYHIFPDRFHRVKVPEANGLIGARSVHDDWYDEPEFRPDAHGEIHNSDFFGGSLQGVMQKLPYLQGLGVKTLYFSPIFEAASNHRYDTADYKTIDPMFGTEEEFKELCHRAHTLGMRVMLDGVFSHTGYDSIYFNGRRSYDTLGAHQSKESPYYDWYDFQEWPDRYSSWWGIYTLPQVKEMSPDYLDYMIDSEDSVIAHWLRAGADAWRLDVADELPDEFIARLNTAARKAKSDAVIIGEVWEDASKKVAYDVRRRYFLGHELHGVMNYPFRNAALGYLLGGDAGRFRDELECLRENYPKPNYYSLMNILGTHDTPRVLTVLGCDPESYQLPREERSALRLTPEQKALAVSRLKIGAVLQFTFPGSPCVYYGDEAGLEGYEDPFNRRGYPWDREDEELLSWYQRLGKLRRELSVLQSGEIQYLQAEGPLLVYERTLARERVIVATNRGETPQTLTLDVPGRARVWTDALSDTRIPVGDGKLCLTLPGCSAVVLVPAGKEG